MHNVVNLRGHLARPEVVEVLTKLLEKAKQGEITGLMHVASSRRGDDLVGCCGAFADRLQYAVFAAGNANAMLVNHTAKSPGLGNSKSGPLMGRHRSEQALPAGLRRLRS